MDTCLEHSDKAIVIFIGQYCPICGERDDLEDEINNLQAQVDASEEAMSDLRARMKEED